MNKRYGQVIIEPRDMPCPACGVNQNTIHVRVLHGEPVMELRQCEACETEFEAEPWFYAKPSESTRFEKNL